MSATSADRCLVSLDIHDSLLVCFPQMLIYVICRTAWKTLLNSFAQYSCRDMSRDPPYGTVLNSDEKQRRRHPVGCDTSTFTSLHGAKCSLQYQEALNLSPAIRAFRQYYPVLSIFQATIYRSHQGIINFFPICSAWHSLGIITVVATSSQCRWDSR